MVQNESIIITVSALSAPRSSSRLLETSRAALAAVPGRWAQAEQLLRASCHRDKCSQLVRDLSSATQGCVDSHKEGFKAPSKLISHLLCHCIYAPAGTLSLCARCSWLPAPLPSLRPRSSALPPTAAKAHTVPKPCRAQGMAWPKQTAQDLGSSLGFPTSGCHPPGPSTKSPCSTEPGAMPSLLVLLSK